MTEPHKPLVNIPFDVLPEAKNWSVGKAYRVRLVLRQIVTGESGAEFEVVDATSLESEDKGRRYFSSENGVLKG